MPRWQKLLRRDALVHAYKEALRHALAYVCPRLSQLPAAPKREPAGMEPLEQRLLLSGSISGQVYTDLDGDGIKDAGEPGVDLSAYQADWGVYIDTDGSNAFNNPETKVTPVNGGYHLTGLNAGSYDIRADLPLGWGPTDPSADPADAEHVISLGTDEHTHGHDFGVAPFIDIQANAQSGPAVIEGSGPVQLSLISFGFNIDSWSVNWGDGHTTGPLASTTSSTLHTYDVIAQAATTLGSVPAYLLADGHGSTRQFTNPAGGVTQRYAYDAHGNLLAGTGLTPADAAWTRILYSGEWTHQDGTQYLRARY